MSSKFFLLPSILLSFSISLIVITSSVAHMLGNDTDRVALLAFKSQISPDSKRVLSFWNTSYHFCEWGGVTCGRRHGRVIELKLDFHGLAGSISPYIGNLSFLRNLNLSNNMLNGQIPQEVGRLYRLQNLLLSNNSLSGPLPINLSRCLNLQTLKIATNKLTGRIPEAYGSFLKLIEFSVSQNRLIGEIPAFLGNLSSMDHLQLAVNHLTGSIPDSLSQLTKLRFIGASVNMLSGMVPPSLFNISSLRVISLTVNHLEGNLPEDIGLKLPKLRTLFIGKNQFSGSIPVSLFTNTSQLGFLALENNKFSGAVPMEIGKQKNLQMVDLENNSLGTNGQIDDLSFLTSLNNCSNLQLLIIDTNNFGGKLPLTISNLSRHLTMLFLSDNQISGSIPHDIWRLNKLILLTLSSNPLQGVIPMSIGMLPNLQVLEIFGTGISGHIPFSIGNMTSLYELDLSYNMLNGNIVTSSQNFRFLQRLYLNHNQLTGFVPNQLFESCTQLLQIDLSDNYFVGSLPSEIGNLKGVFEFSVSENKMSGPIPSTLGSCSNLDSFYIQGNLFDGEIPATFGDLKSIEDMDLSRNNFSGKILKQLAALPYLKRLNLSFNNFEGEVPTKGIFQNTSAFSITGNDKVCGGVAKLRLRSCQIQKPRKKRMPLASKLTLSVLVPVLFVSASLLIILYSKKRPHAKPIKKELENYLPHVSYKELYDATGGFSSEELIGVGSYGSVFKGVLREYERVVAVKVLNIMARGAFKNFMAECDVLRKVRHRNLLKILTVCSSVDYKGNDFKALVFEFMSNGSLESWLHPTLNGHHPSRNMGFFQRLNIAIDIAFALDYLHNHFGTPIVHCDIKPSNVLLNQDMVACLGDFGLAKFLVKSIHNSNTIEESISNSPRGTIGYIPPEYGMSTDVTTEGDVYSYGILILEMFIGKRPTDPIFNNNITLRSLCQTNLTEKIMDILDTRILTEETPREPFLGDIEEQQNFPKWMLDCLISVMKIGVACSTEVIADRMNIKKVVMELQSIKEIFVKNRE